MCRLVLINKNINIFLFKTASFDMRKSHELNKFERRKIINLQIAKRTHKAITHLLKIPQSTITDIIT